MFISEYFSEANEYYGNNSIMAPQAQDSDVNHCEIIVVSRDLTLALMFLDSVTAT